MIQELQLLMRRSIRICCIILFTCALARGQNVITGKIISAGDNALLSNVTVMVKGSSAGVTSNSDGVYSITATRDAVLVFSLVSFESVEIPVNGRISIDVTLREKLRDMDEVVVVGYGTQKKSSLTGAIATVRPKDIQNRPQQNVYALLQGAAPGLHITTNSGRPGREGVNALIRGRASYGTNNGPLIVIDGVPGTMDALNPDDIESVSVLKDASSASIYGSRATNGVILVTTKRGKRGQATISYNGFYSTQKPTFLGDQIWNSAQYMELWNQLADRVGGRTKYSDEFIAKYKDPNKDRIKYPDFNWFDATFNRGHMTNHSINVTGGSAKTAYNITIGYQDNQGVAECDRYKKYTGLLSLETEISKWLKVGTNTKLLKGDMYESWFIDENGLPLLAATNAPMYMPYLPDGSGRYAQLPFPLTYGGTGVNRNSVAMQKETQRRNETYSVNPQLYAEITLLNNDKMKLLSRTLGSINYYENFLRSYYPAAIPFYYYQKESDYMSGGADEYKVSNPSGSPATIGVGNTWTRNINTTWFSTLDFNWKINADNPVSVLVGYQEETANTRFLTGSRQTYPVPGMQEIDGGSTTNQGLSGNLSSEVAIRSVFGRLRYSYKDKYLLEGNVRADGTSRLSPGSRWGTFPSVSAGWKMSEEEFIKNNFKWVDELRLRASYGSLGNSEVGTYTYQNTYGIGSYIFGGAVQQTATQSAFVNQELEWEKTTIADLGLDMTIANGLIGLTFDWYDKKTTGILAGLPVPGSLGLTGPTVNYGSMRNRGVEFEISHRNSIGQLRYGVSFQASLNKNELLKVRVPSFGTYAVKEGEPYQSYYLYVWDGIFQSADDILKHPTQPYANPKPGDIYYKDLNGDGIVNGDDRQVIDGVYPKMIYSGRINLEYKNFTFDAFIQGLTGKRQLAWQWVVDPFTTGGPPSKKFLNAWTPTNTNTNVPALYYSGYGPMNYMSTYYLENSSYLRLKNLQVGYNVPRSVLGKIKLQSLRIYISAENLFTITNYGYGMDPENDQGKTDTVLKYPMLKSFSAGIRLSL